MKLAAFIATDIIVCLYCRKIILNSSNHSNEIFWFVSRGSQLCVLRENVKLSSENSINYLDIRGDFVTMIDFSIHPNRQPCREQNVFIRNENVHTCENINTLSLTEQAHTYCWECLAHKCRSFALNDCSARIQFIIAIINVVACVYCVSIACFSWFFFSSILLLLFIGSTPSTSLLSLATHCI